MSRQELLPQPDFSQSSDLLAAVAEDGDEAADDDGADGADEGEPGD